MLAIDRDCVPRDLHSLIPFAERFGLADGLALEALLDTTPQSDLAELREVVESLDESLVKFLASTNASSPTFVAFAAMRNASGIEAISQIVNVKDREVGAPQLRLFAVACCRRIWDLIPDPRSQFAVETAEQYARGEVDTRRLELARQAAPYNSCALSEPRYQLARDASSAAYSTTAPDADFMGFPEPHDATCSARSAMAHSFEMDSANGLTYQQGLIVEDYAQKKLLYEIVGKPATGQH